MRKILKIVLAAWFVNLIIFTGSSFMHEYLLHIGHWSAKSWEIIFFTSMVTKMFMSIGLFGLMMDGGIKESAENK